MMELKNIESKKLNSFFDFVLLAGLAALAIVAIAGAP